MRCDHRLKLVGYRTRPEYIRDSSSAIPSVPLMDAVLVCLRCTREFLKGVDEKAPATVVERLQGAEAAEVE
ncbi:hypothetical protein LCGC14_1659400 [marine sediment metagenome]|uniref:Uncharacterized protein n=1 Tax=marine sediment metagenome TaxID=412755 RepID=A0A0F9HUJ9_9ZZZZ